MEMRRQLAPHLPWAREVGRRAADPPAGMAPIDVIQREMRAAGIPGDYETSAEWREVEHLAIHAWREVMAERHREIRGEASEIGRRGGVSASGVLRTLTARDLWRAYGRGLSQAAISRTLGVTQGAVCARSRELGFRLARRRGSLPPLVLRGPCVVCEREARSEVCDACAAEAREGAAAWTLTKCSDSSR